MLIAAFDDRRMGS